MITNLIFNDCIPEDLCLADYSYALHNTLSAYKELSKTHDLCVVIARNQEEQTLSETISLKQCILNIENRTERVYALRLFNKYPISSIFNEDIYTDFIIKNDFKTTVNGKDLDATNLAIATLNGGLAFTLGLCNDLTKDQLIIVGKADKCTIDSLYGEKSNTEYIAKKILYLEEKSKTILEKIQDAIGRNITIRDTFKKDFYNVDDNVKEAILNKFEVATKRNILNPVNADNKIIRDVTPSNGKKGSLYELRIFTPIAIRVYFAQQDETTILINIGGKNNQSVDIKNAYNRL